VETSENLGDTVRMNGDVVMSKNPIDAIERRSSITSRLSDLTAVSSGESASGSLDRMAPLPHPLRFVLIALAGWMHQQQRDVIDYLREENRVLREQLRPGQCGSPTRSADDWGRKPRPSDVTS
jgi:hypothetical protein